MLRFKCAAYSGLTVRHAPVYAVILLEVKALENLARSTTLSIGTQKPIIIFLTQMGLKYRENPILI